MFVSGNLTNHATVCTSKSSLDVSKSLLMFGVSTIDERKKTKKCVFNTHQFKNMSKIAPVAHLNISRLNVNVHNVTSNVNRIYANLRHIFAKYAH